MNKFLSATTRFFLLSLLVSLTGCFEKGHVFIVDSAGKPIAGAEVQPVSLSINGRVCVTNARGKTVIPDHLSLQEVKWIQIGKSGYESISIDMPSHWPLRVTLLPASPTSQSANVVRSRPCSNQDFLQSHLGQTVVMEGIAEPRKIGPALRSDQGYVWIDDLSFWPDNIANKHVRVKGMIIVRHDLPLLDPADSGELKQGMYTSYPANSPEFQNATKRYLLKDVTYEVLPEGK